MPTSALDPAALATALRQSFAAHALKAVPAAAPVLQQHLSDQLEQAQTAQRIQQLRDFMAALQVNQALWAQRLRQALRLPAASSPRPQRSTDSMQLELVSDEAIQTQLLASRLATRVQEIAGSEWVHLRLRLLALLQLPELPAAEPLRPDRIATQLVQSWLDAGLSRDMWQSLTVPLHATLGAHLAEGYAQANRFLVAQGFMPDIHFAGAMRKAADAPPPPAATAAAPAGPPRPAADGHPEAGSGGPLPWWLRARQQSQEVLGRLLQIFTQPSWSTGGGSVGTSPHSISPHSSRFTLSTHSGSVGSSSRMGASGQFGPTSRHRTGPAPVSPAVGSRAISPQLQALLDAAPTVRVPAFESSPAPGAEGGVSVSPAQLEQYAQVVRQRSAQLKKAADTPDDKAIIEVVALMFQSILTEERLPSGLRIWFARLQIPVLRVALAEPEFFGSLQHPARQLIDRMGSCALGFDARLSDADGRALHAEIRRVVQMIEQYPESGRRVFQLALDEFEKFLARHLQSRGPASQLVTIAQQVELKETLAIQYTIELRKQLGAVPVPEGVREFLFKVWAEVLAVATVKHGAKHPVMATLKQTASDLLWSASAKPSRAERSQVIAQLPGLLARLREGMGLLGMAPDAQEAHIKQISQVLADAFMARTEALSAQQLAAVTRNLACLEDFLPADGSVGDLELDAQSIELITGVDASNITIITDGGKPPSEAVRAWALELPIGTWFTLDHNGRVEQVQLAWRSQRGQLNLLATAQQRLYLLQTGRMAAYLQTGLLQPLESESLTVRATRAALEKIDANPERLLA